MKGFKSFADTTVLEFEAGVTAVVGPNGSGKSNVVDAVTWVLGAQSTRALRSARMDDVIFMGTANRAALGRAEVALTLDNASGRLNVDGAEVTISRILFRNGDSEYAINGTTCRLLDVQELLGDSGVGRQQHMIIGQGQLDSILSSNPENRRAVIEEAAGVLKHRRRKERAERRLASTQENLERLGDLVREVRRQMRPLERQAASARSYADVVGELHAARHALYATRLRYYARRREELGASLAEAAEREGALRREVAALDAQATAAAAEMSSRREEGFASALAALRGLEERARGTASVIEERRRSLTQAIAASADENVTATLEADAAALEIELAHLARDEASLEVSRAAVRAARESFEAQAADFYERFPAHGSSGDEAALARATERAHSLNRALREVVEAQQRLTTRLDDVLTRIAQTEIEYARSSDEVAAADSHLALATRAAADAELAEGEAAVRRDGDGEDLHTSADEAARATARAETLERALAELSGSGGREVIGQLTGVLGPFFDLIDVTARAQRAVEAAAGVALGATVVDGRAAARAALAALRRGGDSGVILSAGDVDVRAVEVPAGCRALRSSVQPRAGAPTQVNRLLDALFARAVVAGSWEEGMEVALKHPDLVVVTDEGDCFAASGWRSASGRVVVTGAALDQAKRDAQAARAHLDAVRVRHSASDAAYGAARDRRRAAATAVIEARRDCDRRADEARRVERQLEDLRALTEVLNRDAQEILDQRSVIEGELEAQSATLPELERAHRDASARAEAYGDERAILEERRRATDVLALEFSQREAEYAERRRLIETRRGEIERRLEGRSSERLEAATRRRALEFDRDALERLAAVVERASADVRFAYEAMETSYRDQLEVTRASADVLEEVRTARREIDARISEVAQEVHRCEIERAELSVTVTNVFDALHRDLGLEANEVDDDLAVDGADVDGLSARVGELEAVITSLGPINPLALEELTALEDRYKELDAQVSDVRHARRELLGVLRSLDDEIMSTFTAAFADVNEHFSTLVATLFPGGQGRLKMSDPDDPLTTGVEIEVRPMGRNVRRISLLSGGERSMAALAFLFAVFRSRPSPFYLMDEVEAALDDVNLQRFLKLVDEFRDEAQLLVVTHQKRTMEAADVLYGVTMVPGASSKVVSQRVQRSNLASS